MALHKAVIQVPMSYLGAELIQQLAAMADPIYELLEAYRNGSVDERLPAWPSIENWRVFYAGHRPLAIGLDAALPGILNLGEIRPLEALDGTRLLSRHAREEPEAFKATMAEIASPQEWRRSMEVGIYERARQLATDREQVEADLAATTSKVPALPGMDEIRRRAASEFDRLEEVLGGATVEEKRELIACYVQKIKADPDRQTVEISLYPTLLS